MKNDSVEIAFELMIIELDKKSDDLNSEGAALFKNSKYEEAAQKASIGLGLKQFRKKVEELRDEWLLKHSETFPITEEDELTSIARKIAFASKSPKTVLVVKFGDGTTIYESVAADTFTKSLRKIGFDRVAALGIRINHEDLVSRKPPSKYNYKEMDGYFVVTHSSTDQKREHLERISQECGISMSVNVVDG